MAARVPPPLARVRRFAARERLFRRVDALVVAVSGGPDSLAALLLLREMGEECGFELAAAHFDHQLRPDSAADRDFTASLCERLGIPCVTGEGDVRQAAAESRAGIEETARRLRYRFLAFAAERRGAGAVATGHTADDHAETVLHHILRGSGVRGARGLAPAAPLPDAPALRLLRPLLPLSRADTLAVCEAAGVEPRADETNASPAATRNRIRHDLLPRLRGENPSVDAALIGLAESARELFRAVESAADLAQPRTRAPGACVFELEALRALGAEARLLVLEREAAFLKADARANRTRLRNLADVLERGAGRAAFGEIAVEASAGLVRLSAGAEEPPAPIGERFVNLPGVTVAGDRALQAATAPFPDEAGASPAASVSPASVDGALRLRSPRPGDRMAYRGHVRKVSGILKTARVPVWERRGLVALAGRELVAAVLGDGVALAADAPADADGDERLHFRLARPSGRQGA